MGISLGASDLEFGNAGALRDPRLHDGPPPLYPFYFLTFHGYGCSEQSSIAQPVALSRSSVQRARPTPNIMMTLLEILLLRHVKTIGATNDKGPTLTHLCQGSGVRYAFIDPVSQALRNSHIAGGPTGSTMTSWLLVQEICRQVDWYNISSVAMKKAFGVA